MPRRIVVSLLVLIAALLLVRGYVECLQRYHVSIEKSFDDHPWGLPIIFGAAVVASTLTGRAARLRLGCRLVLPISTVTGALTTAAYSSLPGAAIGVATGLLLTVRCLPIAAVALTKWASAHAIPALLLTTSASFVSRIVQYQGLSQADIQRLSELGPDVQLIRCALSAGAVAELVNHPRVFHLIDPQAAPGTLGRSKSEGASQ